MRLSSPIRHLCSSPSLSRARGAILGLGLLLLGQSCGEEIISRRYCDLPARFSYSPVSAVSQLYTSCNSMGQWCTILATSSQFVFSNPEGSTPVARTAVTNYTGFYMGLSGFIVGLPSIPEMGSDYPVVTCYDLACRNCYEEAHVTRRMTLNPGGTATCSKCQRTYNLNDQGLVAKGEPGKSLFRYHVVYASNTLAINNR